MQSTIGIRTIKFFSAAAMLAAYLLLAFATFHRYLDTCSLSVFFLLIVNTTFLGMYATRRDTALFSTAPLLWLLAFCGTFAPLLMRPLAPGASTTVGIVIQMLGSAGIIGALSSLRRSFGIVPANRGVRTEGLYRLVRHPLYAAELLALAGVAIGNPSVWNVLLWCVEVALQFARARAEERFLAADPVYADYCTKVRYRLIPLVV